jgi:hypothetical protein
MIGACVVGSETVNAVSVQEELSAENPTYRVPAPTAFPLSVIVTVE